MYVLENPNGRFYIGSTGDTERRLRQHNPPDAARKNSRYTHKNAPWHLVRYENHPDLGSAVRRERQIKRMKSARWIREHLLNRTERVPARRD